MNRTKQQPTIGRIVLLKFLNTAGIVGSLGTVPAIVIAATPGIPDADPAADIPPRVTVCAFGAGPPNAPIAGTHVLLSSFPLYDPTNPDDASKGAVTVPADAVTYRGGPFDGKPVWCEWMPYQKAKAEAEAAGVPFAAGPPR